MQRTSIRLEGKGIATPLVLTAPNGSGEYPGDAITGPTDADKNLGLKYFLNGALVSNIVLDTSVVATDTIDYVATDPEGLTATSTRTGIIEPSAAPSIVPDYTARATIPTASSTPRASTTS